VNENIEIKNIRFFDFLRKNKKTAKLELKDGRLFIITNFEKYSNLIEEYISLKTNRRTAKANKE
jgi:hypothetical protein